MTDKNLLLKEIRVANFGQRDALWAILKYKNIGIFRKVSAMCAVFNLNFNEIIDDMPQDDDGRIYDKKTRLIIHDALMEADERGRRNND